MLLCMQSIVTLHDDMAPLLVLHVLVPWLPVSPACNLEDVQLAKSDLPASTADVAASAEELQLKP